MTSQVRHLSCATEIRNYLLSTIARNIDISPAIIKDLAWQHIMTKISSEVEAEAEEAIRLLHQRILNCGVNSCPNCSDNRALAALGHSGLHEILPYTGKLFSRELTPT